MHFRQRKFHFFLYPAHISHSFCTSLFCASIINIETVTRFRFHQSLKNSASGLNFQLDCAYLILFIVTNWNDTTQRSQHTILKIWISPLRCPPDKNSFDSYHRYYKWKLHDAMAVIKDPAFWRRFSVAVHMHEIDAETSPNKKIIREDSWLERQRRKNKRTRVLGLLIAVIVLTVIGGVAFVIWWFTRSRPPKDAIWNGTTSAP